VSSYEHPRQKSDQTDETRDPVDSICLPFDGIKRTLPFRVADYGDDGALTEAQIQWVARCFDLDIALARDLSLLLGFSLDIDSEVNLVRVRRAQTSHRTSRAPKGFTATCTDDTGAEVLVEPQDKRRVLDARRLTVIESCCYIWLDAGRRLTFTTRGDKPSRDQRDGPLVNLIQTVIEMVTTPPCRMSGETLRRDIERVRRRFRRRGDLPPA